MSAYLIAGVDDITDAPGMDEYRARVGPLIQQFGGVYLAAGPAQHPEGDWRPGVLVVIQFPSIERLREWYDSAEYQPLKQLRMRSMRGTVSFVEGL